MNIIDKDLHTKDLHEIAMEFFLPTNKNAVTEGTPREFKTRIFFIAMGFIVLIMLINNSASIAGVILSIFLAAIGIELVWRQVQWLNKESGLNGILGMMKSISWIFAALVVAGVAEWFLGFWAGF